MHPEATSRLLHLKLHTSVSHGHGLRGGLGRRLHAVIVVLVDQNLLLLLRPLLPLLVDVDVDVVDVVITPPVVVRLIIVGVVGVDVVSALVLPNRRRLPSGVVPSVLVLLALVLVLVLGMSPAALTAFALLWCTLPMTLPPPLPLLLPLLLLLWMWLFLLPGAPTGLRDVGTTVVQDM